MNELLSDAEIARRVGSIRHNVARQIPIERKRRNKRIWIVSGVVAAAVAATGAALVVRAASNVIKYEVRCYEAPSLDADYGQVQSAPWVDDNGNTGQPEVEPTTECAELWRAGLVGQPTPPDDPNSASFDVPELVACELPDGSSAVFPRETSSATNKEFCNELGLAPWE
ncbi:hypothetical protein [Demequina sp.]|uniref:hypothetical protein n=1 Tax=Demequina sp. TaxID=2050685 RepID=UPI003D0B530D